MPVFNIQSVCKTSIPTRTQVYIPAICTVDYSFYTCFKGSSVNNAPQNLHIAMDKSRGCLQKMPEMHNDKLNTCEHYMCIWPWSFPFLQSFSQ